MSAEPEVREATAELRVEGLSVDFGGFRAVDKVSLSVRAGERHALIGPNGAGKTTMMNAIAGAVRPSEGDVFLGDQRISSLSEHRRAALGISRTYQITNLFEGLSVLENVRLALLGQERSKWTMHRLIRRSDALSTRAAEMVARVGLERRMDDEVESLSHGEKRQLELAVGLAAEPSVLLLDEPAAGLSDAERQHMLALIDAIPRHVVVVIIEHNMDLILAFAEIITVLNYGAVIAQGAPEEVRNDDDVRRAYLGDS